MRRPPPAGITQSMNYYIISLGIFFTLTSKYLYNIYVCATITEIFVERILIEIGKNKIEMCWQFRCSQLGGIDFRAI